MSASKIIYSSVLFDGVVPAGTPRAAFYADSDDHLRVPALLTLALRARHPDLKEQGQACVEPRASWRERLSGLQEVVESAGKAQRGAKDSGPLAIIENLEALDEGHATHDEDEQDITHRPRPLFDSERQGLKRKLLELAEDHGLWVQTGWKSPEELERAELWSQARRGELDRLLSEVPVAVRDLMYALVDRGLEDVIGVELMVEASEDHLTEHLLWESYTRLPARARDAARKIAALRGEQRYNGVLGELTVHDVRDNASIAAVGRREVVQLVDAGWLKQTNAHTLVMPWQLRSYALKQASMWTAGDQQKTWDMLVATSKATDKPAPAAQMELHHRAIEARDIETAWASAVYYEADMLALARRLSDERSYQDAADIYREITKRDPKNAYAWEYLAYNLVRVDRRAHHAEITAGYEKAHTLSARPNSLFWARWLCWRIERRMISLEQAGEEFHEALRRLEPLPQLDRFSRFARPVGETLRRMGREDLYREWTRGWEKRLELDPKP